MVTEHIECRSLINPDIPDVEQGKLEMWLDLFPESRPPPRTPIDITPPKPVPYQLRVTIQNTSDIQLNTDDKKPSDIYVKAWILGENDDSQQTNIHSGFVLIK